MSFLKIVPWGYLTKVMSVAASVFNNTVRCIKEDESFESISLKIKQLQEEQVIINKTLKIILAVLIVILIISITALVIGIIALNKSY